MLLATYGIVDRHWFEIVAISIAINVGIFAAVGLAVSLAVRAIRVAV
jgi:hypothetical protein